MNAPVWWCPGCGQGPSFYQRREDGLVVSDRTTGAHLRFDERGIVAGPCPGTPIDLVAVYERHRHQSELVRRFLGHMGPNISPEFRSFPDWEVVELARAFGIVDGESPDMSDLIDALWPDDEEE